MSDPPTRRDYLRILENKFVPPLALLVSGHFEARLGVLRGGRYRRVLVRKPRWFCVETTQTCHSRPPDSLFSSRFCSTVVFVLWAWLDGSHDILPSDPGLIRYFAVRDVAGAYRGCLEVTEDVTENRKLTGERRLLEWGAE